MHSARKSQTTMRPFQVVFEVGAADLCLKIEGKKEAHSTRTPRRRLRASRGRGGHKELQRVHVPDAAYSLRLALQAPCHQFSMRRELL
jgi:hypothetical protein